MKAWPEVALCELLQRSNESTVIDPAMMVIAVPMLPLAVRKKPRPPASRSRRPQGQPQRYPRGQRSTPARDSGSSV